MFPEGTRSRGRGLMPFKTGAFHAAIAAGVPIVPICVSTTSGNINLNRWNNGHVIVEMLAPVDTSKYGKENVRELAAHCRELMEAKIAEWTPKSPSATPPKIRVYRLQRIRFNWRSAPLTPERLLILIGGRLGFAHGLVIVFMEKICHSVDVSFTGIGPGAVRERRAAEGRGERNADPITHSAAAGVSPRSAAVPDPAARLGVYG